MSPTHRLRRSNRGRRFRRHRGRQRRRCRCRQFNRSKLHRRAGDHGARQAHQLLPPSVKLAGADPVFAGDLGCGQIRPQAFGDDLALLVGRPRPPRFSPGQNLDASLTSAPVITRTSALSFRDQVRRHHIHPQTRSYSGHEPPDVADAPLTPPLLFGIHTRSRGCGRYSPAISSCRNSSSHRSSP